MELHYDSFYRSGKTVKITSSGYTLNTAYDWRAGTDSSHTTYMPSEQTETLKNANDTTVASTTLKYTYDVLGNIETVKEGSTQKLKYYYDDLTYINETDELVHLMVKGEEIITTPSHPFYSPVKGWVEAVDLRAGDILVLMGGEYVIIEQIQHEILENPINVYNLNVEDDHTYFVSAKAVLVHNSCGGETSATKYGREQHKNWDYGGSVKKEVPIPGAGRADAVDFKNHIIYELKPNNTKAVRQGWKQLTRYQNALERKIGGIWIRILDLYEPLK